MLNRAPTRLQFRDAQTRLEGAGWTHVLTVMADRSTRADGFGLLYARGPARFWLNRDTIGKLPR